jgi:hypothetical protein
MLESSAIAIENYKPEQHVLDDVSKSIISG